MKEKRIVADATEKAQQQTSSADAQTNKQAIEHQPSLQQHSNMLHRSFTHIL